MKCDGNNKNIYTYIIAYVICMLKVRLNQFTNLL